MALSTIVLALLSTSLVQAAPSRRYVAYGFDSWEEVKARGIPGVPALNEDTAKIFVAGDKRQSSGCAPLTSDMLNALPDAVSDVQVHIICFMTLNHTDFLKGSHVY
jgi:hypothetical protein